MSSVSFKVTSYRDNKIGIAYFQKGNLISYDEEKNSKKEPNGTLIEFSPDKEVFKDMEEGFTYERVCNEIKNIAYLNKGIHFVVTKQDGTSIDYYSENGIADFIKDNVSKPLMQKPIVCSAADSTDEVEIAFMWTGGMGKSYVFVNGLFCPENGTPVTGAKTALTSSMKKLSGKDFDSELIRKGLVYAINCKVENPSFANQTKSKINNANLRTLASKAFKEGLEIFSQTKDFGMIVELITKIQKAERAADKARENILNQTKEMDKELKKKSVLAGKLADCRYHNEDSQLLIVEGDSAAGGVVKARNSDYTAVIPLRGKVLNVLKASENKISENEVLKMLHIAIGSGFGEAFNSKKLRYGRIGILTDLDEDGYSIMCLLLAYFYKFYPQLIIDGRICWGMTPLFIVDSKSKTYYAYSDDELKKLPKGDVTRAKGLGELETKHFKDTLFSDNGRWIKFTMNDAAAAYKYFDTLLGDNIQARKEYLAANADFDAFD